jgi:hypothetical protein
MSKKAASNKGILQRSHSSASMKISRARTSKKDDTRDKHATTSGSGSRTVRTVSEDAILQQPREWEMALQQQPSSSRPSSGFEQMCLGVQAMAVELFTSSHQAGASVHHNHGTNERRARTATPPSARGRVVSGASPVTSQHNMCCITFFPNCEICEIICKMTGVTIRAQDVSRRMLQIVFSLLQNSYSFFLQPTSFRVLSSVTMASC